MTDRELLEKAAKAAGMETRWDQPRGAKSGMLRARVTGSGDAFPYWNPLDDDGEALRLAVKLGINIELFGDFSAAKFVDPETETWTWVEQSHKGDPNAATRRVIVSAAAAMVGQQ